MCAGPPPALVVAGKAFREYRGGGGGVRTSMLPDFFIGARAALAGLRLLARGAARYRNYFPNVEVVAPDR